MVRFDGVNDRCVLAKATSDLGTDHGVRATNLVGDRLADVVKERSTSRLNVIDAEFRSQHAGDVGRLDQVVEHVLTV